MKKVWDEQPALFLGLNLLLGSACALYPHPSYLIAFAALFLPLISSQKARLMQGALAAALSFAYALWLYPVPVDKLPQHLTTTCHFHVSSLRVVSSPFQRSFVYQGVIGSGPLARLPCQIYQPLKQNRPLANGDYLIEGRLSQKDARTYVLKPAKDKPWRPVPHTFSFAEWRYQAKETVRNFLKERLPHSSSQLFLTALSIGEVDERILSLEFSKLGLQHILGISGFHFALLAGFLGIGLRLFFPFKVCASLLLILLSFYFFFVGNAPAVLRGYTAICIYLVGRLFGQKATALNALGVGLIVELLVDPLVITNIGFQLSFVCTLAILLLYPHCSRWLTYLLPKRSLSEMVQMSGLSQHGYLFSSLIRESMALNLAVHLASTPLVLFLFHKFPLQSLIYNLFFPLWSSLAFILLLIALPFTFLPILSAGLYHFTSSFSAALLALASHPPTFLEFFIRVKSFPFSLLIAFLALFFALLLTKSSSVEYK